VIRCLISDGTFSNDPERWLAHAAHWFANGVELLQIRERDLPARDLAELTRRVQRIPNPHGAKILVNDRADVAIACGADGVHLRDGSVSPAKFAHPGFLVTVACHPLSKADQRPVLGTGTIEEFTRRSPTPVLALGGITSENARACMDAGASGIAGIKYFER
jgi:thiamine-phosphate pyrophosphorylase